MGALAGKIAIVTGAARGIGRGEARALAAEGAAVVVNDVDADGAASVAEELGSAGASVEVDTHDITTWEGASGLVGGAVERHGRLDVLVNNAGVLRDAMSFNMAEDDWDAVVEVHMKGHAAPSRFAASHWRDRAKAGEEVAGRIVNTVSEAGLFGNAGQMNYDAAKAGIAGMTLGMARELAKYGVTVNAIAPRARTAMTEALLGDFAAAPDEGFDEWDPDNIGPVVAWLCSDAATDVNGQVFVVFGGRVHLMQGWTMVAEIEQDERWTVDTIAARADELFGDRRRKVPRMGFGR